ncbi:unnamed protein product [Clonostachys solani]|uniref:Topoisomerase 1-associated factor 1 n=1 Tax=Clonostachys solani TaxID=160281 RepID=A0A9P0EMV0_9HYPO|nr:unnamed protein product [Clonostachys solani]
MEMPDGTVDVVHPEVRAHINSLVSALGGISAEDDDGRYQLGDDALEVLRDLKRWIRFYDEKTNRMDVARCIYEANLIEGDLLPILAAWPENEMDSKYKSRMALACFELMVPLTWPMERDKERMTVNHHRHIPVLELAQVAYKRAIVNFDGARILHAAVRVALPAMAIPIGERTQRDQGIIKLVLFLLRNVAAIALPLGAKDDGEESQISRSVTIDAFSYQDIFHVLLTLASNMGDEFRTEDTTVMEIIYHLVKRVNTSTLFVDEKQLYKAKDNELAELMKREEAMLKSYTRPTRHNRFGTMIWVKREDGKMTTVTGQEALVDVAARTRKMDSTKTFKPPRRGKKEDKLDAEFGRPPKLNARANGQLRTFTEEFLDSGFNPLFSHIRRTLDREATYVLQHHRRQFFYLVGWFLEAERMRRKTKKENAPKGTEEEVSSFNLVAGVLNQEMFITLNKGLHESYEYKDWHELTAVMRCFTQILLTVQEMYTSGHEGDEEIAENILSRLFYEETTHDAIASIIRTYKDQGFDYLDAATELVHQFLRILEMYSKQNVDMQVRSRKRTRQKKQDADGEAGGGDGDAGDDESGDDQKAAERTIKERKFDFHRFCGRFSSQGVVDTFVRFTKYYRDLTDAQLKRAHRFFYRVAFKQEMSVMLFRVDIVHLLYNMIKGPEPLDKSSSTYKEWTELVKQILRKCFKKIEERPELIVELLFSKIQSTAYYLEFGYEKQTSSTKAQAKPGAELEFKHTEEKDRQVAIVVGTLLDKNQADHIAWLKGVLSSAESERRAWAAAEDARAAEDDLFDDENETQGALSNAPPVIRVEPDDDARKTAVFKNSHLRLLMTVAGLERDEPATEETADSSWVIPPSVSADTLKDTLHYINQAEFSPPVFDEGVLAENMLKRKTVPRKKAAYDDDDENDEDDGIDDDMLFPMGGPTARKAVDDPKKPKKKRLRRKQKDSEDQEIDDEELNEKARKRREREKEKARKIKSALYVKEGDDEFDSDEDEEFFARERAIAARAEQAAAGLSFSDKPKSTSEGKKKRKSEMLLDDDDEEGDDGLDFARRALDSDSSAEESEGDDAPVGRTNGDKEGRKRRRMSEDEDGDSDAESNTPDNDVDVDMEDSTEKATTQDLDEDGEEEVERPVVARRPRVKGGFVIDSDDED